MTTQPIPITVTRYRCPHCTRSRSRKTATSEHMTRCWMNPAVRACKTCTHHQPATPDGPDCWPSRPCSCNRGEPEHCTAGRDLAHGVHVACPQWEPAPGIEPAEPITFPCRDCGTPLDEPQRRGPRSGRWICDPCAAPPADGRPF